MQMNNDAIKRSFLQAKNLKEQLKILAELNGCEPKEIRNILIESGLREEDVPRVYTKRNPAKPQKKVVVPEKPIKAKKAVVEPVEIKEAVKAMPAILEQICVEYMAQISEQIVELQERIKEYEQQLKELDAYMKNEKA